MFPEDNDEDLQGLDGDDEIAPEHIEREAKALGWVPEDKFRGDKKKWVDAAEFVERGKHLMPVLAANNERLKRELLTRDDEIGTLKRRLDGATVAIDKLEKHYTEANKRAVQTAKDQLKLELRQAVEDRDTDAEFAVRDKLDELKTAEAKLNELPEKKVTPDDKDQDLSPDFRQWQKENPWYGEDKKKTKEVIRIAEDLRDEGNELLGMEFMDECVRVYEERQDSGESRQRPSSKVEGGKPPARSAGVVKGWNDLPKEAKQACLADEDDLVGPDKKYKTLDDWKKRYVALYYAQD